MSATPGCGGGWLFWPVLVRVTFGWWSVGCVEWKATRDLGTPLSWKHGSTYMLTQLGLIMSCSAVTECVPCSLAFSPHTFHRLFSWCSKLDWLPAIFSGSQPWRPPYGQRPTSLALSGSSLFLEKVSLCPLPSGSLGGIFMAFKFSSVDRGHWGNRCCGCNNTELEPGDVGLRPNASPGLSFFL